ncbi:type II toxin-antitoxin system RelE/ParE family toxin [Syntrophothermus lipocalidus]|uniref:Addiction module toxin, RelE/StbE family n=1 Tax=Syntrophothermus lipocalidus (strain DSM 12680 / TGB-C1) TaxID=643648 RepID=D7CMJ3_SYNLT|nr:type II toxin-antitoxin system RelE/ParE family toxin [Syntrophothermus lipocalidus]ADI01928.1 addiction module toxin, RelE/StbE family [Syntrophothermus lipocalidus DSM 12680]
MYEIIYLPIAKQDITDIILYISDQLNAPKAAMDLLDALEHSISLLRDFPYAHKIYRPIKPLGEDYRMLIVKNYAVFYVVREAEKIVEVHRVIYAKMDLTKLFK